ncbi:hypothetical protein [Xanthomonas sp. 3075]|uniref:hypothetical protein n=1 Tax=Xanthomonas sp. 3075 TaxID=3035315 RepID=UPI0016105F67|nr:hypothetical protein [Xanthomonas sp. 3075]MBB4132281.1 hypothetical protein [Xanthomonas sp. 3075]
MRALQSTTGWIVLLPAVSVAWLVMMRMVGSISVPTHAQASSINTLSIKLCRVLPLPLR